MTATALVWFKRDLRVRDHAPLAQAQGFERAAVLYVIEPAWLASAECDPQHVDFALRCLAPLQADLAARGLPLLVRVGALPEVLAALRREIGFTHLFSHQETGPGWTFERDRAVGRWCRDAGVAWTETPQTGVVRGLKCRDGWAARWARTMGATAAKLDGGFRAPSGLAPSPLPSPADLGLATHARPLPEAGEAAAHALLDDFTAGRARGYRRALSSPLTAEHGCSRLSAHLAFGTLSMRQVHQATEASIAGASAAGDRALAYGLRGLAGRLRWHCHFMQKLEDEPAIEWRNFSRAHDGLRPGDGDPEAALHGADRERFEAWCEGRTGFPMVDACMRSLRATGWLNFRMRAMLVSFAAYHLWLHWRQPGQFLARQFLDFEPGIHWSQMQMQSGTTGINTLRIYSPAKQARDHDPGGAFVRRWVPEVGTPAYPPPIVDERAALARARERLYALRRTESARAEAAAIQQRHGSRKAGLPPSGPARRRTAGPAAAQQELF
jgi:deoxyribodipyrimidine photo-lyase